MSKLEEIMWGWSKEFEEQLTVLLGQFYDRYHAEMLQWYKENPEDTDDHSLHMPRDVFLTRFVNSFPEILNRLADELY